MNNYSRIYSHFNYCGNSKVSAKYFVDNLVMCENRVNTHTHSHRAYFTENILDVKELAKLFSTILLHSFSDLYLRNGAPPLHVTVAKALCYYYDYGVISRHSLCLVWNAIFCS